MATFQKKFNTKLRLLCTGNPKEYWSLICTNDGKETLNKIQLVLAKYFAGLKKTITYMIILILQEQKFKTSMKINSLMHHFMRLIF